MNYKVQPHSEEAEKALLGSILTGGSEVFVIHIKPLYF